MPLQLKVILSKIVLNIHFYENAILETCRINEVLSCNKLVISENPDNSDKDNKEYYDNLIIYYNNIDDLINKASTKDIPYGMYV